MSIMKDNDYLYSNNNNMKDNNIRDNIVIWLMVDNKINVQVGSTIIRLILWGKWLLIWKMI